MFDHVGGLLRTDREIGRPQTFEPGRRVLEGDVYTSGCCAAVFHKGKLLERHTDITPTPSVADDKTAESGGRLKVTNPQASDSPHIPGSCEI
jgi:hypothetical protein